MAFAARNDVSTPAQIALRNSRLMQERVSQSISFPVTGSGVDAMELRLCAVGQDPFACLTASIISN